MDDIPRNFFYRFLEIIPGLLSWIILIVPIFAVFKFPRAVAIFVMIYILWLFLRSIKSSVFLIISFLKSRQFEKTNWHRALSFFSDNSPVSRNKKETDLLEQIKLLKETNNFKKRDDIYHMVIMPTYKEEKDILESSIAALAQVDYPLDKIIFVLATEERDKERALENSIFLQKKFGKTFGQFHFFMHPADLPGEIAGKGANISYAGKKMENVLQKLGIDFSDVIVTTLDADNRPHKNYFSILTFHYLMEADRKKRSYQPLPFFYSNIWEVPFVNRLVALVNTFWFLAESGEPYHLRNASAHAQSFDAISEMDFWSKETIIEDYHQFWRSYFHFKGDHKVIPLFVAVYQDALQNKTYFTSLVGQYRQLRRWAWAAAEIPYVLIKMWRERKHLPFFRNLSTAGYLCQSELLRPTAPIIIFFYKAMPGFASTAFSDSLFAYNLSSILEIIFTVIFFTFLVSIWISLLSLPFPKTKHPKLSFFFGLLQWIFLPVITIFYGAVPALEAQTRIMLGKPLGFMVTEKIRKIN